MSPIFEYMIFILKTVTIKRKSVSCPTTIYYKATCREDKLYIYDKFLKYNTQHHTKNFNGSLYSYDDVIKILKEIDSTIEIYKI